MSRLACSLIVLFLLVLSAHAAIQLGDTGDVILRQYGDPASVDLDRELTTYRWSGWRLDINFVGGIAQRLVFTKDNAPISEAEERQLLNDNGGVASWQVVESLSLETAAVGEWRRTTDGAEAFASGQTFTLYAKLWIDTQVWNAQASQRHAPAPAPTRIVVTAPAINPLAAMLSRLTMMAAGAVVLLGIIRLLVMQSSKSDRSEGVSLRTPKRLRSSCTLPPPLPFSAVERLPPLLPFTAIDRSPPTKPKTLVDLSWQEFELVIGELYRRREYSVEMCSGDGSDGGVDLRLRKDSTTVLVQCKHWKVYQVGVSTVREMFGILTAEKADHAILVTTGKFTRDAALFAAGKPLELIDGARLEVLIEQGSRNEERGHLLDVASWSDSFAHAATIVAPVCPTCRSGMAFRVGRQSGNQFWGCVTYPRCRGNRNVRVELMRA